MVEIHYEFLFINKGFEGLLHKNIQMLILIILKIFICI